MSKTLLETLGSFVEELTFDNLPDYVIEKANDAFFDLVGCYYGALKSPDSKNIIDLITNKSYSEESSIWGTGKKTSADEAALIGGFLGYSLEFDDGVSLGGHWGSASIPAICAVAEKLKKSGKDVITAIVCAYEVGTRISRIYSSFLLKNKVHFPCAMGFYAASAGVAKLMGLKAKTIAEGLANGCLAPIGPYSTALSGQSIKNMYSGWPNFLGVRFMEYATNGFGGDVDAFESPDGLGRIFCGKPLTPMDKEKALDSLNTEYMIMQSYFKPYPCCRWLHAPLYLLQTIMRSNSDASISSIEVAGPDFLSIYDKKGEFSKIVKAQYSIPYTLAAMALHGTCTIKEFQEPFRTSSQLAEMSSKINIVKDQKLDIEFPKTFGVRTTVSFTDGRVITKIGGLPWSPDNPATKDELINKFKNLTFNVLGDDMFLQWKEVFLNGIHTSFFWEKAKKLLSKKLN